MRNYNKLFHALFWIGFLILLNSAYAGVGNFTTIFIRNFITALFHAFLFYANIFYFIPKYLSRHRYLTYYGGLGLIVIAIVPLRIIIDDWLLKDEVSLELFNFDFLFLTRMPEIMNVAISSIVTLLIAGSFTSTERRVKNQQLRQELKNYRLEAELKLLRTQVNPHFLFNALNNIYTLAYTGSKETASMVAKLSQMMRYMLESSKLEKVSLEREIDYLHDYISLQQLKTAKKQNISFNVQGNTKEVWVEPMLFIPFFENCFKHGNISDTKKGWVKSELKVEQQTIHFSIVNSIAANIQKKDRVSGIGLDNVQQRLQLLYPNCHQLKIEREQHMFSVYLTLVSGSGY